jgi:hypothetical protein
MSQTHPGEKSPSGQVQIYHSYLLRFWEERGEDAGVWRFMLEEPQTGHRQGFADLESFVSWLRACVDEAAARPRSSQGG